MSPIRARAWRQNVWSATRTATALTTVALLLTGCSSSADVPSGPVTGVGTAPGDVPEFEGPWAADFTFAYGRAQSDFERGALADGQVTDAELAEMRSHYTECLSAYVFTDVTYGDDGAFGFDAPEGADPDTTNEQVKGCSIASGEVSIGALHSWIRRNPTNQDESTIVAACLVRKEAVDPSYTAADYDADIANESFSFIITPALGDEAFRECNSDPLGLFG